MASNIVPLTQTPAVALRPHPVYSALQPVWEKLAHAAEGLGGFMDGTYLVAHPREWLDHTADTPSKPTKKLLERRKLARYEGWPDTILTLLGGALFRTPPTRRVGDVAATEAHPLADWWADVDGLGTPMDAWMAQTWLSAAVFGHVFILMDRDATPALTAADAGRLYLRRYTPLDVPDWLVDERGDLVAVRMLEVVPRGTFDAQVGSQVREVTPQGWRVLDRTGTGQVLTTPREEGQHDYAGALPVVVLYAKRRPLTPLIGQSVLGDPAIYADDYNLSSEVRELLRKQTFSILNIPLGTGQDAVQVSEAQAMLGESMGTANVAFTPQPAAFITADPANVEAYQAERQEVRRTMFRLAGLPWEGDSRAAESGDSRRIKREDLNQTLARYADEVQTAERALAQLWCKATYGATWEREWDQADIEVSYPETFDSEVLDDTLTRAQLALTLRLGKTATDSLKRELVGKLLPDLSPATVSAIEAEIAAMPDPEEERQERQSLMAEALKAGSARPGDLEGGDA